MVFASQIYYCPHWIAKTINPVVFMKILRMMITALIVLLSGSVLAAVDILTQPTITVAAVQLKTVDIGASYAASMRSYKLTTRTSR